MVHVGRLAVTVVGRWSRRSIDLVAHSLFVLLRSPWLTAGRRRRHSLLLLLRGSLLLRLLQLVRWRRQLGLGRRLHRAGSDEGLTRVVQVHGGRRVGRLQVMTGLLINVRDGRLVREL